MTISRPNNIDEILARNQLMKESSMLKWFPIIENLPIPQPRTIIVEVPYMELSKLLDGEGLKSKYLTTIKKSAERLGYPIFLRTDNSSQKHSWSRTCYCPTEDVLMSNLLYILDSNAVVDLIDNAVVLRQFIPMESAFTAFLEFPVSKEMRHFIKDGKVQCKHWYWFEEVMRKQGRPKDPNWSEKLKQMNTLTDEDTAIIDRHLYTVCQAFPEGYWSVDFCKGKDGKWYLIDMARGEVSFHYPTCRFSEEEP